LGRSASVAAAAEQFERLLAAKIGADRAPKAVKAILTAPGLETAAGRLVAEIDACEVAAAPPAAPDQAHEPATIADPQSAAIAEPIVEDTPAAPNATRRRRDADIEAKARQGELPPPPDFSAPTHARFRAKLAALVELARKGGCHRAFGRSTSIPFRPAPRRWPGIAISRYWRSKRASEEGPSCQRSREHAIRQGEP
jgi:hypothetical protein